MTPGLGTTTLRTTTSELGAAGGVNVQDLSVRFWLLPGSGHIEGGQALRGELACLSATAGG